MSFKDDIPHYKSMQDNDYYYNSLPNGFWSELLQFILGIVMKTKKVVESGRNLRSSFFFYCENMLRFS